jgi:hypothetical protein
VKKQDLNQIAKEKERQPNDSLLAKIKILKI